MQNKIPRDLVTVELKTNEDKVDERIIGSHCRVKYNRCLIYSAFAEKEKKKKDIGKVHTLVPYFQIETPLF